MMAQTHFMPPTIIRKKKEREQINAGATACFCKTSLMFLLWSMTVGEMRCRIKGFTHLNQQLLPVTTYLSSPLLKSGF